MRAGAFVGIACSLWSFSALAEDPVEADLQRGRALLDKGRYQDALKAFQKAHAAREKRCFPCLLGMAEAQIGLGEPDDALDSCEKALKLNPEDPGVRARALNLRGLAQARQAGKGPDRLRAAEESFRKATELAPDNPSARFNLGYVLLQQSRDDEGVAELQRFLDQAPGGAVADMASVFIANPRRAGSASRRT